MTHSTQSLQLVGDQQLVLETSPAENVIRIVGSDRALKLSIQITPSGPILKFEGAGLTIQSAGTLAIDAKHILINGREGLTFSSGSDARIQCSGDLDIEARSQSLTAVLGNVNVRANDDVRLDGERIRMNC